MRGMNTHSFDIEGMTCNHCVRAVKAVLEATTGVKSANVEIGHADVQVEGSLDRAVLVAAIEEEGYRVASP